MTMTAPHDTTLQNHLPTILRSRPMDVPIKAVHLQRDYYEHYPAFQRDRVWPPSMQRELIDSILHGFYVPALLVCPRAGGGGFWVIDGQQRLSTILAFMNDEFKTGEWADVRDEPGHQMREPRRLFSELSPAMREQCESYLLRFIVLDNVEDHLLSRMYRRLQHQIPLTTSEKLWSYSSQFTHAAVDTTAHPFFAELYIGRRNRKQTFQMATYVLIVEQAGLFVGLEADRLRRYCSGRHDHLITQETRGSLALALSLVQYLFAGSQISVMTEIVLLLQAVRLLEAAGFDLSSSEQGCLSTWYQEIQRENQQDRARGFMNLFSQVPKVHFQRQVWQRHFWTMASQPGLAYRGNPANKGRAVERILAWIRTDRHCIQCKKPISLDQINVHIVRPSDYVDTSLTMTCLPSPQEEGSVREEETADRGETDLLTGEAEPIWVASRSPIFSVGAAGN